MLSPSHWFVVLRFGKPYNVSSYSVVTVDGLIHKRFSRHGFVHLVFQLEANTFARLFLRINGSGNIVLCMFPLTLVLIPSVRV